MGRGYAARALRAREQRTAEVVGGRGDGDSSSWERSLAVRQGLTPSACPSSTCVLPCASLRTIVGGAAAQDRSGESVGTRALAGGGGRDGRAGREPCITWHGAVLVLQTTSSVSCVAGSCAKCGTTQPRRFNHTLQSGQAGRGGAALRLWTFSFRLWTFNSRTTSSLRDRGLIELIPQSELVPGHLP